MRWRDGEKEKEGEKEGGRGTSELDRLIEELKRDNGVRELSQVLLEGASHIVQVLLRIDFD